MIIMFDLENTLIDSWNSGCRLNKKIAHVHRLMEPYITDSTRFGIFSFAVDHEYEKPIAIGFAESCLPVTIDPTLVVSFDDITKLCRFRTDSLQKWEIVNLMGKDLMFPMWCNLHPDEDCMLFDDALPNSTIVINRLMSGGQNQQISMVRV